MNVRKTIRSVISLLWVLASCQSGPGDLLERARVKINESDYLSYRQLAIYSYPDIDRVDTLVTSHFFQKNTGVDFGYDYLSSSEDLDDVYIDGMFSLVNHQDSSIYAYPEGEAGEYLKNTRGIQYAPSTVLNLDNWEYNLQPGIEGGKLSEYIHVIADTVIGENHIKTTFHLFIDPNEALLERLERRNFFNGERNQTVVFHYSDYRFSPSDALSYDFPKSYDYRLPQGDNVPDLLAAGEKAPPFTLTTLDGRELSLETLKGKRLLLFLGRINCSYCKLAVEQMNKEYETLSAHTEVLYINPVDRLEDLKKYRESLTITFPILLGTPQMATAYRVMGYPIFYLIDEEGVVLQNLPGYNRTVFAEFLGEAIGDSQD